MSIVFAFFLMLLLSFTVTSPVWLLIIVASDNAPKREKRKKKQKKDKENPSDVFDDCGTEPFSAAEYLERMERVALDIQKKREREKPSKVIVLWLLLDGLQINADGTHEWIKRYSHSNLGGKGENGSGRFASISPYPFYEYLQIAQAHTLYPACSQYTNMQSQQVDLQYQLTYQNLACAQSLQTQLLLNSATIVTN